MPSGPQPYREWQGMLRSVMKRRFQEDPELTWANCKRRMKRNELAKRKGGGK